MELQRKENGWHYEREWVRQRKCSINTFGRRKIDEKRTGREGEMKESKGERKAPVCREGCKTARN